jgi:hypothetical protein
VTAVERILGALLGQVLADAGYEAALEVPAATPREVIIALDREGRGQATIDAQKYPRTAQRATKLQSEQARIAYRRRKAVVEAPNGWIKAVLGFRSFSPRGLEMYRRSGKSWVWC